MGRDRGRITSAPGYASFGEPVRRSRNKKGKVVDLWLGGSNFKPEKVLAAQMERKYTKAKNKVRG